MSHENDLTAYHDYDGYERADPARSPHSHVWHFTGIYVRHAHTWLPWHASGGRFDWHGDIETRYVRWCKTCQEFEERTLPARI